MIRHMTYLDIPSSLRANSANKTREQIRSMLTSNFLTPEQVTYLQGRLTLMDRWEKGAIAVKKRAT